MLIVLEGIDGCGKTTVAEILKEKLEEKRYKVYLTKEPFNQKIREVIKEILEKEHELNTYLGKTLALLFSADRHLHQLEIMKKISEGYIVISDRYYHSSFAYQTLYDGITFDFIKNITPFLVKPDYVFILDVPVDVALNRMSIRDKRTRYEEKDILEKVRENYLRIKDILKEENIYIINNNRDINETIKEILSIIRL